MDNDYNFKLSKSQGDMLARAISILSFSVVVCFSFFIIFLLFNFVSRFSDVLLPPVVAIVLAMMFKPYYFWLYKYFWRIRVLALIGVFLTISVPIIAFIYIFGAIFIDDLVRLINASPQYIIDLCECVEDKVPVLIDFLNRHGLQEFLKEFNPSQFVDLEDVAIKIKDATISIGSYVSGFFGGLFSWLVLPVYLAIFLTTRPYSGKDASKTLIFLSKKNQENFAYLIDQFLGIIVVYFRAQVLVAAIQGILFAVLFHLLGLKYGLIIGISLGFLNIVPYLGNILGWLIIIPLSLFGPGGGAFLLIKIVIAFCAVQTLDGYFITPRIMKDRTGLNTFVIIFSLFFWGSVIGGVLGMLLAIPLSAFIVVVWRLIKKEYFANIPNNDSDEELKTKSKKKKKKRASN